MEPQTVHNDPTEAEQASGQFDEQAGGAPGEAPGEATLDDLLEPVLGPQASASDFSESAVLGRRGQAARTGWRPSATSSR